MDTDLQDMTAGKLRMLWNSWLDRDVLEALETLHARLKRLESQASPQAAPQETTIPCEGEPSCPACIAAGKCLDPQETTTETRWERSTTLTDAPTCEHEPDPWAIKNAPQLTACIHCALPMVLRWVPAGSA